MKNKGICYKIDVTFTKESKKMIEKVKQYAEQWHMLKKEDRIIVGVSGGADSVCLLFVLKELKKEIPFELFVVHVNHQLRGESADSDELFVKELCQNWKIPFYAYSENVELIAKNRKQSTEEAGRDIRRTCFQKTLEEVNANKIALAHHKNDNAETLIMNLARGTGLKGMGGIRPVQGVYIRPLLCVSRMAIESYICEQNLTYCCDVTNESDDYTRNRIRNNVIPYLEREVNSAVVEHMGDTMEQLQQVQNFMEVSADKVFHETVVWENACCLVKSKEFENLHIALKPIVLKKVLRLLSESERDIEQVHLQAMMELFRKQVGKHIDLPYQLMAKRTYDGIKVQRKEEKDQEEFEQILHLQVGEEAEFIANGQKIYCKVLEYQQENYKCAQKAGKQCFDYDIIQNRLTVRTKRAGDYITIHPDGRTQKLKSFFINEKVPQDIRNQILLVADGSHILWIVGMRVNCAYQVSHKTKYVLEIQIDKGVCYGREN